MNESLTLLQVFMQHGSLVEIPLNYRIFLHNEEDLIWLEEGNCDLFALEPLKNQVESLKTNFSDLSKNSTPFLGNEVQGSLHFLRTTHPGDVLFGFSQQFRVAKPLILAIATSNTKIRKLPKEKFLKILEDHEELNVEMDLQIGRWVNSFSPIFLYRTPPKYFEILDLDKPMEIGANVDITLPKREIGDETISWLKIEKGLIDFAGLQTLALTAGEYYFPLSPSVWLQTAKETKLEILSIQAFFSNPLCANGFKLFQQFLIDALFFNKLMKGKKEINKIQVQAKLDQTALTQSIEELGTLFIKKEEEFSHVDPNHIYRCCQVIGNTLHLQFIPIPNVHLRKFFSVEEYLTELCRNSRIQYRRVTLLVNPKDAELGPLLCFHDEAFLPFALLPLPQGGYQFYEPDSEELAPFEFESFSLIQPTAYVFYRAFPEKEILTEKDAFNFLFAGLGTYKAIRSFLLFGLLTIFVIVLIPFLTRQLFGVVIANLDYIVFAQVGMGFSLIALSTLVFSLRREYIALRLLTEFDNDFTLALWQRVLSLPVRFFHRIRSGDLFIRMQVTQIVRRIIAGQVLRQILAALFSGIYVLPMFYYNASLAWVSVSIISVVAVIYYFAAKRIRELTESKLALGGTLNEKVIEILMGINAIRIFGCESRFFSKWERLFFQNKQIEWKIAGWQGLLSICGVILSPLSLTAIFGYMLLKAASEKEAGLILVEIGGFDKFRLGDFMGFYMAFALFSAAIADAFSAFIQLTAVRPILDRTKALLAEPVEAHIHKIKPGELKGSIRVDHVDFSYDPASGPVLSDISFHAAPGEFVAIVGHSGGGKSTLIRLLIGFETPTNGAIYYDGRELANLDIQEVRSQMGIILQNSSILDGTIRDNVMTGGLYTEEEVVRALTLAGFADDLAALPMGLDTVLMNGGSTLSGGQKQRILIARALIGTHKILVFDEASSALDNETQEVVSQNLAKLNMTRIVIAHRLSTIRSADRIYVLDKGRIIDQETFRELSSRPGLFYEFLKIQRLAAK